MSESREQVAAKLASEIQSGYYDGESMAEEYRRLTEVVARALAACALREAKWWEAGKHTMSGHGISGTCPACERLRALERAAGEKS